MSIQTKSIMYCNLSTDVVVNVLTTDVVDKDIDDLVTSNGIYNALSSLSVDVIKQIQQTMI